MIRVIYPHAHVMSCHVIGSDRSRGGSIGAPLPQSNDSGSGSIVNHSGTVAAGHRLRLISDGDLGADSHSSVSTSSGGSGTTRAHHRSGSDLLKPWAMRGVPTDYLTPIASHPQTPPPLHIVLSRPPSSTHSHEGDDSSSWHDEEIDGSRHPSISPTRVGVTTVTVGAAASSSSDGSLPSHNGHINNTSHNGSHNSGNNHATAIATGMVSEDTTAVPMYAYTQFDRSRAGSAVASALISQPASTSTSPTSASSAAMSSANATINDNHPHPTNTSSRDQQAPIASPTALPSSSSSSNGFVVSPRPSVISSNVPSTSSNASNVIESPNRPVPPSSSTLSHKRTLSASVRALALAQHAASNTTPTATAATHSRTNSGDYTAAPPPFQLTFAKIDVPPLLSPPPTPLTPAVRPPASLAPLSTTSSGAPTPAPGTANTSSASSTSSQSSTGGLSSLFAKRKAEADRVAAAAAAAAGIAGKEATTTAAPLVPTTPPPPSPTPAPGESPSVMKRFIGFWKPEARIVATDVKVQLRSPYTHNNNNNNNTEPVRHRKIVNQDDPLPSVGPPPYHEMTVTGGDIHVVGATTQSEPQLVRSLQRTEHPLSDPTQAIADLPPLFNKVPPPPTTSAEVQAAQASGMYGRQVGHVVTKLATTELRASQQVAAVETPTAAMIAAKLKQQQQAARLQQHQQMQQPPIPPTVAPPPAPGASTATVHGSSRSTTTTAAVVPPVRSVTAPPQIGWNHNNTNNDDDDLMFELEPNTMRRGQRFDPVMVSAGTTSRGSINGGIGSRRAAWQHTEGTSTDPFPSRTIHRAASGVGLAMPHQHEEPSLLDDNLHDKGYPALPPLLPMAPAYNDKPSTGHALIIRSSSSSSRHITPSFHGATVASASRPVTRHDDDDDHDGVFVME
jgi:hypothetical protein